MVLRLNVAFRTIKNSANLTEEKRREVERLEIQARDATNNRQYGEAVKHLSHGLALMRNQAWTPARALNASLQVKADRVILEPGVKVNLALTQLFPLDQPMTTRLIGVLAIGETKNGRYQTVRELKQLVEDRPDFSAGRQLDAVIPDLPDGNYQLVVNYYPENEDSIFKPISIQISRGLTRQIESLEARTEAIKADLRKNNRPDLLLLLPEVEYTASMLGLLNTGELSVEKTNLKAAVVNAAAMLDEIAQGRHPLDKRRGDIHLAYRSAVDDTLQPYRLFVPANYQKTKRWPLVVALHGMGSDENTLFDGYQNGEIKRMAEARGYLVVCPKGRGPTSMYLGNAERDVIDVIGEVKREYVIDEDRVYLMGHSMGGYGTWSIAVNHPGIFAALAPIAGGGSFLITAKLRQIKHIPWIVTHGTRDATVPVEESRKMVQAGLKLGIKIKFNEIAGGDHFNVVVPAFKEIFDWFDAHKRSSEKLSSTFHRKLETGNWKPFQGESHENRYQNAITIDSAAISRLSGSGAGEAAHCL